MGRIDVYQAFIVLSGFSLLLVACSAEQTPRELHPFTGAATSSPIALSPDEQSLWVANPDANSVTRIDTTTLKADAPVAVGQEPWGVAVMEDNRVLALNRQDGTLSLLKQNEVVAAIEVGSEPGGVVLSPTGRLGYVTVSSSDEVVAVDLDLRRVLDRIPVGRLPWAIGMTNDGDSEDGDETVVVTHRLSRERDNPNTRIDKSKEGWVSVIAPESVSEVSLGPFDFGFPNVLEGLALMGDKVWIAHLLNSPDLPRDFKSTVSGGLSTVSLTALKEQPTQRIETNKESFSTPTNFPRAVAVTSDQQQAYVVLAGTNAVMGIDISTPEKPKLIGFWGVGSNPRGIVLNRESTRAYVMNYLSRDVSVLDLTDTVRRPEVARIPVTPETLSPELLRGKVLFNNANDPRISNLGWMSCASCHIDGGVDGTTWGTPEGMRQTMPLWNLQGTAPFHASATRDEIQDFEADIEHFMDGVGLASGPSGSLLQSSSAGQSADLDALAKFVLEGTRVPNAPTHNVRPRIARGRQLFIETGCATCHGGERWTSSHLPGDPGSLAPNGEIVVGPVLHDVGTFNAETDILGEQGFDIPTLLGLGATAPYLHDGSAATLMDVLSNEKHAGDRFTDQEFFLLSDFLSSIDGGTPTVE